MRIFEYRGQMGVTSAKRKITGEESIATKPCGFFDVNVLEGENLRCLPYDHQFNYV